MNNFPVLSTFRRYAGKIRTLRNEARTARMLNSLPPHMRADIGWPDRRDELWPRR
jgi:hypothetical protein